jgi:hypothetical protein
MSAIVTGSKPLGEHALRHRTDVLTRLGLLLGPTVS